MIRFLKWLLTGDGHVHKYVLMEKLQYGRGDLIIGYVYINICSSCGKIKTERVDIYISAPELN